MTGLSELSSHSHGDKIQWTVTSDRRGCSQLRLEIKSLATPDGKNVIRDRQFYPSSKLRSLITRDKVLDVLNCPCPDCQRRFEYPKDPKAVRNVCDDILNIHNIPCFNGNDALQMFALVVCIECPQFIFPLLKMYQLGRLPNTLEELSEDFLRENVWPQFDRKHPNDSRAFAQDFYWQRYKFAVGSITNEYQEFDKHVILPFINERSLDEGGFGKVYSFEIVDGYRRHLSPQDIRRFARKELHNPIPRRFNAERINLELIRHLADPHLISIVKAYKHGDCFNFVFPCARTNLDVYLRDPQFQNPAVFSDRVPFHRFWIQMLGIAGALRKIHSLTVPGRDQDFELYGYHFDIKPANILVMDNGTFVITDFGQANFKRKERGTSRVTGMGGTEAYAPPEFDDSRPNRKYDVWSLGCVFLETCTFIALRYDGVKKLDRLKFSQSADGRREYESFYEDDLIPNSYRLKRSIADWIEGLPKSETIHDEESRQFFCGMLALVTRMLQVDVAQRLNSEQVCNEMNAILQPYLPADIPTTDRSIENIIIPPDENELGAGIVPNIGGILCLVRDHQFEGPIRMVTNTNGEISILTMFDRQLTTWNLGLKTDLLLIPQYAFSEDRRYMYSGSHVVLESAVRHSLPRILPLQLVLEDARNATTIQSILLGQEVKRSLGLNGIEIRHGSQLLSRVLGRKPKQASGHIGRGQVQLWLATPATSSDTTQGNRPRRLTSRTSQLAIDGPTKRRVAIICSDSIYTIAFSKAVRLKARARGETSLALHIVPTDETARPSIAVSRIRCGANGTAAAIPLDQTKFEREEAETRFQCQTITITFQCLDDVEVFWSTYQSMKEAWKAEDTELQSARRAMGPVLGYAPN